MCNSKKDVLDNKIDESSDQENEIASEVVEEEEDESPLGDSSREAGNSSSGSTERQNDRENGVLQWLQALDIQVVGACRVDERLKPLLKLNVSCGLAEDTLLSHLSQHFEVPEIGMLARCLCVPLVSVRVGKIVKQGKLLCPTSSRGNLNLTLLLSSEFRLSFVGDDGCVEILVSLSNDSENSVAIEEIPADESGRSFFVELFGQVSYFWCSEQSKITGFRLLSKMKDLLGNKPCLAQLSGISKSRLDGFATHFQAYLGSTNPTINSSDSNSSSSPIAHYLPRHISGQAVKQHPQHQCILSPRSNSFKESASTTFSSPRNGVVREKFKRRGDSHCSFASVDSLLVSTSDTESSTSSGIENGKLPEMSPSQPFPFSALSSVNSLGESAFPPFPLPQTPPSNSSLLSPYYCWCPPCPSTLQYTVTPSPSLMPMSLSESLTLPPLSSLLGARSVGSFLAPLTPLSLADISSPLEFPAFLPDLPVSSLITMSSNSQPIPLFTPLMCDPIVHIPVMDICSSGQSYLVSAGAAMSTTIPTLHSNFVTPLIPSTESLVEKGARETLRLLLSSTQTNPQLMEVLPCVATNTEAKHCTSLSAGSRGFYSGSRDVSVITNSIAMMGLVSLPPHIGGGDITKRCSCDSNLAKYSQGAGGEAEDDEKDCRRINGDSPEKLDAA